MDLGSDTLRWKDGYFNGTVRSAAFRGVGSGNNSFIANALFSNGTIVHYSFDGQSTTGFGRSAPGALTFYGVGSPLLSLNADTATFSGTVVATTFSGNANTATQLLSSRSISLSGAVTATPASFNGSANISIPVISLNAPNLLGLVPPASLSASNFPTGTAARTWVTDRYLETITSTSPGTIVMARWVGDTGEIYDYGETVSGDNLRPSSASGVTDGTGNLGLSSVWRCLGRVNTGTADIVDRTSLWVRVS